MAETGKAEISVEQVEHVAMLARLELTDEEKRAFARQLSQILKAFEQLQAVPTDDVPPMTHPLPLSNVLRKDEARPSLPQEAVLQNAPDPHEGYFRVPRILE